MRRKLLPLLAVAGAALVATGAVGSTPRIDYAAVALNILPPGQSGDLRFPPTASDQLKLYDALTPRMGNVQAGDLTRYFKPERFGVTGKVVRTERPRQGVRIVRDTWDVPHVYGRTRAEVEFGAGYATAEDRYLFMELLRGPGRIAALDVPGVNPFGLALSGRQFVPTEATENFLRQEIDALRASGPSGRQVYADAVAYVDGVNSYYRMHGLRLWTLEDVLAVGSLLGADLGVGGGDEYRRSEFLDALEHHFGADRGLTIWRELAQHEDPHTPVSVDGEFPYDTEEPPGPGNVVVDDGSFSPSGGGAPLTPLRYAAPIFASNALLVAARRSATHHPLFVAGPQVGYYFPEILLELDLHGGGIDARGAAFPGISFYIELGRGKDFAWSGTSASSDIIDHYVETLCGDDMHYLYNGECRAMTTFDAGTLKATTAQPDRELVFRETVHGPVIGYATVKGQRVAISMKRSTRGREAFSLLAFQDLNTNKVHDPASFFRAMNQLEYTFNWFYADDRHIAMFSSGRLPIRAPGVASGLPTDGSGAFEWRGFEPLSAHVRGVDPKSGVILNWNNKPGLGFSAADNNWNYGPVHRVQLLQQAVAKRRVHTLATLVGAMNTAATQDLRAVLVFPTINTALGAAPNQFDDAVRSVLVSWVKRGAHRLDLNGDGKLDDPGAAVMDAAWPQIADAVLRPTLGPLTDELKLVRRVDDPANSGGSSYATGWYNYVVDSLTNRLPGGSFCGSTENCRAVLWSALDAAGRKLAEGQGPDPSRWRADATPERLTFGYLQKTARWTNRPTFQQVISFDRHRPR